MKLMVFLLLIAVDSLGQVMPIREARKLKAGTIVTVAGRVTASKEFGDLSFIQDQTGGIPVYGDLNAGRGDSIIVTGKLSRFNGLLEILLDSVTKIEATSHIITPLQINIKEAEDHEAELVTILNVILEPSGHFFYPQRGGNVFGANDTLNYWIDGDSDLPGYTIPAGHVSLTGVVGRYRDQFQLMPRDINDITGLTYSQYTRNAGTLSIMNWNLEFFGATREQYGSEYGPPDEALQVTNVATLLNHIQPDVVALQEISDDVAFKTLLTKLPGFEGRCSNRYSYSEDTSEEFPPQKLCYVYKKGVVRVVREKVLFRKVYDDGLITQSAFASGRLPYLLEVDINNERVYLVNIHGKSGATADDHDRRLLDARLLKDTLDVFYNGRKLVVLGDFNDDLDASIAERRESPYAGFVADPDYNCISKTLSDNNWHSTISYDDVIDHQITSNLNATSTVIVNPFVIIKNYATTTSDHVPVLSGFDLHPIVTGIGEIDEILTGYRLFDMLGRELGAFEDQPPGVYILMTSDMVFRIMKQ